MKHICQYCNTEFDAPRKDKNYCDASCRQQAYMLRKGTAMAGAKPILNTDKIISLEPIKQIEEKVELQKIENEKEYKPRASKFISKVDDLLEERNHAYLLRNLIWENPTLEKNMNWINVRLRCLVECLLTLSERKTILLNDLAEITNAFTLIIRSSNFQLLPNSYPYTNKIKELRNKLKSIYMTAENMDEFHLTLGKSLKIELLVMRCELRTIAPRRTYNQLQFKEEKKSCETNHLQNQKPALKQWQINLNKIKIKQ